MMTRVSQEKSLILQHSLRHVAEVKLIFRGLQMMGNSGILRQSMTERPKYQIQKFLKAINL